MKPRLPRRSDVYVANREPRLAPTVWRTLLVFSLLVFTAHATAQDPQIRTSVSVQDPVWTGQQVTLVVELLAPGYFASAASFDIPDPQTVLLMPPQGSPLVSSETIDGTRYSVQRHELPAWPMQAGEQSIPPFTVRFAFKRHPLDQDGVPARLGTEAVAFTVQQPPGAENLGTVISARDLQISEDWQPPPGDGEVEAGDAFTRTVRFTALDIPGMVFPPFPAAEVEGLGVYPKRQLDDRINRGELVGERRDTITYVAEEPGQHTIPAVRFSWFDLDTKALRTRDFPAVTLDVVANPALASAAGATGGTTPKAVIAARDWRQVAMVSVLLLALLAVSCTDRARGRVERALAALRPVHLAPLHPPARRGRGYRPR